MTDTRNEGFSKLIWRYRPVLFRLVDRLGVVDELKAEELVVAALALAEANESWLSQEEESARCAWLSGILLTLVREEWAQQEAAVQVTVLAPPPSQKKPPDVPWERVREPQVRESLRRLAPELRVVLRWRVVLGLRCRRIAERLDLPYEVVRERLRRARQELRKFLYRRYSVELGEAWLEDFVHQPD